MQSKDRSQKPIAKDITKSIQHKTRRKNTADKNRKTKYQQEIRYNIYIYIYISKIQFSFELQMIGLSQ